MALSASKLKVGDAHSARLVEDLKRTRVMNIQLGGLPAGKARVIEGDELEAFLTSLGL